MVGISNQSVTYGHIPASCDELRLKNPHNATSSASKNGILNVDVQWIVIIRNVCTVCVYIYMYIYILMCIYIYINVYIYIWIEQDPSNTIIINQGGCSLKLQTGPGFHMFRALSSHVAHGDTRFRETVGFPTGKTVKAHNYKNI